DKLVTGVQTCALPILKATVQAASEQLELIARIFAGTGFKQLFKGLLKLLVEHQPRARIVRLRNAFVAVDPKAWDAEMDVSVNVRSEERRVGKECRSRG